MERKFPLFTFYRLSLLILFSLLPASVLAEDDAREENAPRKILIQAASSVDREELSSRFAFLSERLAKMPELPKVERLDGIASPPRLEGGEISFGNKKKRVRD